MAIYHLSVKPVQRSKGRSVTAAVAYRAGCVIEDKRTGLKHDYTKKHQSGGIVHSEIIVPDGMTKPSRNDLWNWAELAEKRKDACTGREYEVNLPYELSNQQRILLTQNFSKRISNQFGVAVDFAIHKPTQKEIKGGADPRNYHAHIMTTTRKITNDGLTEKADIEKAGRKRKLDLENIRKLWADTTNQFLEMAGLEQRIDHRSLEAQGVNRKPTIKMGWESMAAERAGYQTVKGDINRAIQADNEQLARFEADLTLLRRQAELEQAKEAERQADEAFEKIFQETLRLMAKQSEQRRQEKLRLEREQQEKERQEQLRLELERQEKQRKAYEQRITRFTRQTGRADKAIARSKPRITATKQRADEAEQALAGAIPDTKRYSGRLSQLRLLCERIKRNVDNTEQTIERASQIIDNAKRFIERTQQTINGTNQEIKQLEQQRQEKARQEQLRLEQERQEKARQEQLRLEQERQEKARQEQLRLEQEHYKRENPYFDTPLAQLAKPQLNMEIIEGRYAIQKQVVSLEHALNLYKQFVSKNWIADTGEAITLEFEGVHQNNKTEQLMCDRFIELADKKEMQKLDELVHDLLTKTPLELHLTSMVEFTGELTAVKYNAYVDKISFYSKLDFQIQIDGLSMANKLENNAQPSEINKNQSKFKIGQLIENLDCKKYYQHREHKDLNLVEFLQQTNATISKRELVKVNDKIEELVVAEQAQQEKLRLEQERRAQIEPRYRSPTREHYTSNTKNRDDGPSFNF